VSTTPTARAAEPLHEDAPRARREHGAVLRLEAVSRWYGDVMALNAVELTFGPGVTGLLGPNGAGKSTLIRLVTGLGTPGEGTVTLDGRRVRNDLRSLARIGYVADGDGLYDELTARRFVDDQARLRGYPGPRAAELAERTLRRVGLQDALDDRIGSFSKGMRQRTKLAQAILHEPDVLVLDEPLTGLDPVMRRGFIRVIRELGDEGVTVIASSHVLHEIEAMTDTVVLLHHGQVLAEGTVADIRDVLDRYARRIRLVTADPRGLAGRLIGERDLVSGVSFEDGALIVETMRPDHLCGRLQAMAAAREAHLLAVEPLDDDLASVFAYLVE